MATSPGPDSPAVAPEQARALLVRAPGPALTARRDRRAHTLGVLGAGLAMAAMVLASSLTRHQAWYLLALGAAMLGALGLVVLVEGLARRHSTAVPRGTAKAERVASWAGFGVLVVGRPVLDALAGDGPAPLGPALLLSAAVALPFAAAAHRIWWGDWLPGRQQ
ncbi:hypothetical protein AAG589_02665 [Isoptericola sp. F-RaC21]|uniref:hypothetical protein n=1 Tax=Isoptericola sp. F-RaC21 TaxID=3141452 RepID=UPI00315BE107